MKNASSDYGIQPVTMNYGLWNSTSNYGMVLVTMEWRTINGYSLADGLALGAAAGLSKVDVELIIFLAIMLHKVPHPLTIPALKMWSKFRTLDQNPLRIAPYHQYRRIISKVQMDFMALFTVGTGGHYIAMLPADWSISTSHDPFALQFLWYGIPSIDDSYYTNTVPSRRIMNYNY